MKISLITPAKKHSKNGNRTSALRWARFLRDAGHRVRIDVDYADQPADLMIAIHAWRSSTSILRYRERYPEGPLVVALGAWWGLRESAVAPAAAPSAPVATTGQVCS